MLETSEQRTKLLKAGFSGKEIERLYIEYNNFKIVYRPILYEISEFNEVNMKTLKMKQPYEKDEEIANKIYSLKVGFDEIIAQLEKQHKKAVDEAQEQIDD